MYQFSRAILLKLLIFILMIFDLKCNKQYFGAIFLKLSGLTQVKTPYSLSKFGLLLNIFHNKKFFNNQTHIML